ncbi:MAG: hypothetical protein ACE5IJ_08195 [Thermoplasmata archaeon]
MAIIGPPVFLIFPFSVAFPVLLGTWAISRYGKDRFMVAIGALAILIGFALGIMNVIVISEYWFYYSGAPERTLFVTAMMELLFVPLIIFGGLRVRGDMVRSEDWKRSAKWLSATIAAVLIVTVVGGSMMPITKIKCQYGFDIRISVNVTGSYYVYLPVPLLGAWNSTAVSEIVYDLQFVDGDGDFSVIDTVYGPALRVTSTDAVILETRGESESASFYRMSLRNTSHMAYGEYFWVFTNKSFNEPISIEIDGFDRCVCASTNFHLTAEVDENGWWSYEGILYGVVC